jgi:hypothetical protein
MPSKSSHSRQSHLHPPIFTKKIMFPIQSFLNHLNTSSHSPPPSSSQIAFCRHFSARVLLGSGKAPFPPPRAALSSHSQSQSQPFNVIIAFANTWRAAAGCEGPDVEGGSGTGGGDAVARLTLRVGAELRLERLRGWASTGTFRNVVADGARLATVAGDRIWSMVCSIGAGVCHSAIGEDECRHCSDDAAVSIGFERSGIAHRTFSTDSLAVDFAADTQAVAASRGGDADVQVVGPTSAIVPVRLADSSCLVICCAIGSALVVQVMRTHTSLSCPHHLNTPPPPPLNPPPLACY